MKKTKYIFILFILLFAVFINAKERDPSELYSTTFIVKVECARSEFHPVHSTLKLEQKTNISSIHSVLKGEKITERVATGFFITDDGIGIVPAEVVENAKKITIKDYLHKDYEAQLIGIYKPQNIALIKVKNYKSKKLKFGDSAQTTILDYVWTISYSPENEIFVISCIVSGLHCFNTGITHLQDLIQVDLPINSLMGGAPLLNLKGEVIGICHYSPYEGVGFCTPINKIKDIITQLKNKTKIDIPYLGISLSYFDFYAKEEFNIDTQNAIYIKWIIPDSPASKSSSPLAPGDVIITIDSISFVDINSIQDYVLHSETGKKFEIRIKSPDGEIKNIEVHSSPRPDTLMLNTLDLLYHSFGLKIENVKGKPIITKINDGSFASKTNMKLGKRINYILPGNSFPKILPEEKSSQIDIKIKTIKINNWDTFISCLDKSYLGNYFLLLLAWGQFFDQADEFKTKITLPFVI